MFRTRGAHVCRSCTQRFQRQLQPRRAYSSATAQPDIYDVVCVGGGPAGLSLLTALREYFRRNAVRLSIGSLGA